MLLDPVEQTWPDPESRHSYSEVEACPHAQAELDRLCGLGYLRRFATLDALQAFLPGRDIVVSKFGQIIKQNGDEVKRRLILDSKESRVTSCARKNERIILPTVPDLCHDVLELMAGRTPCSEGDFDVEIFILDVKDAF